LLVQSFEAAQDLLLGAERLDGHDVVQGLDRKSALGLGHRALGGDLSSRARYDRNAKQDEHHEGNCASQPLLAK
jgi:hypothetical protein